MESLIEEKSTRTGCIEHASLSSLIVEHSSWTALTLMARLIEELVPDARPVVVALI